MVLWNFDQLWKKLRKFYNEKNYGNVPKELKVVNKFIALKLGFTLENYGTIEKLWYYSKL